MHSFCTCPHQQTVGSAFHTGAVCNMASEAKNQREVIRFNFLLGKSAAEIHRELVTVFGRHALSERQVRRWCEQFRDGNLDTTEHRGGDHQAGPARDERIEKIENAFRQSRAWSMRALSAEVGVNHETCRQIVTQVLKMKKLAKKWVPHELTPDQTKSRVDYCRLNLRTYNQQTSRLEHTVAVDETWVSLNRPPERDQAREWRKPGEKPTTVVVPNRFGRKVMMALAMDFNGICYYEILDRNEKMDSARYLEFLNRLINHLRTNRRHTLWLLDDNAKPHRTEQVSAWLKENKIEQWKQPAYSPDLSPCDYGCFHLFKRAISRVPYATIDLLREAIDREIRDGNQHDRYLAVRRLPELWTRCIQEAGEYL